MKARPLTPAQGGLVVVPSQLPPLTALTNGQSPGTAPAARRAAQRQASTSAASAAPSTSGEARRRSPPSSTINASARTSHPGARARCRRRQSRAVVCGTPMACATGRAPAPATMRATALPITDAGSSRWRSRNAGSSAWVTLQLRHLARRTQIRTLVPWRRTNRRYPDQKISSPWQDGHRGRGTASTWPAAAYASTPSGQFHTMPTGTTPWPFRGLQGVREGFFLFGGPMMRARVSLVHSVHRCATLLPAPLHPSLRQGVMHRTPSPTSPAVLLSYVLNEWRPLQEAAHSEVHTWVPRDPETCFDYVANFSRHAEWATNRIEITPVDPNQSGAGARGLEPRNL
jgi:hypothetical protein